MEAEELDHSNGGWCFAGWGLSRAGLSKIEAGLRLVNDAELWMLAKVLACPLADLFPVRPKGIARVLHQGRG